MPDFSFLRLFQEGIIDDPGASSTRTICDVLSSPQSPLPPITGSVFMANSSLCDTLTSYLIKMDKILWHPDVIMDGHLTGDTGIIILIRVIAFVTPFSAHLDDKYFVPLDESFADLVMQTLHAMFIAISVRRSLGFSSHHIASVSLVPNDDAETLLEMLSDLLRRCILFTGRTLSSIKVCPFSLPVSYRAMQNLFLFPIQRMKIMSRCLKLWGAPIKMDSITESFFRELHIFTISLPSIGSEWVARIPIRRTELESTGPDLPVVLSRSIESNQKTLPDGFSLLHWLSAYTTIIALGREVAILHDFDLRQRWELSMKSLLNKFPCDV